MSINPSLTKNAIKRLQRRRLGVALQQWQQDIERCLAGLVNLNSRNWERVASNHESWHTWHQCSAFLPDTRGKRQGCKTAKTKRMKGLHSPTIQYRRYGEVTMVRGIPSAYFAACGLVRGSLTAPADYVYCREYKSVILRSAVFDSLPIVDIFSERT